MSSLTSQPADGVGVDPAFSAATFLWNAVAPRKNQRNGALAAAVKGTTVPGGAAGTYHLMNNTDGAMVWPATPPAGPYTLVVGLVFPVANTGGAELISIVNGSFRLESSTSLGGVYNPLTHQGVGQATRPVAVGVASFNTNLWTLVFCYTGAPDNQLRVYYKKGDGGIVATTTETIAYSASATAQVAIGDTFARPGGDVGLYAAMIIPADVGDTVAQALRDNIWSMFSDAPAGPTITGPATFNLAENATAGPTYTTDIDLGSGYPQKAGVDAALFNLVSTGTRQWQFQKTAAGNYESPDDDGANRVYDVSFVASDSVSTACAITLTNVAEPPGAPTAVAATPGNASASVAFTAAAANGGPSPTSFTVTSSPGGIQATGPVSPIVVPGLTNDTPYTFTVVASSSEGNSVASAASNSVTPAVGSFAAALAAVATDYTGSTRRLNTAFDWVASPWTTPLAQATATRVSGSGTTSAVDGTASIALPNSGQWEVRQYFKDGSGNVIGMSRQFPTAA